jgi:hypothetical protein
MQDNVMLSCIQEAQVVFRNLSIISSYTFLRWLIELAASKELIYLFSIMLSHLARIILMWFLEKVFQNTP